MDTIPHELFQVVEHQNIIVSWACPVHNLSVGQVPERLTQLQYKAENSGAITKLLGGGAVLIRQLWLNGVRMC